VSVTVADSDGLRKQVFQRGFAYLTAKQTEDIMFRKSRKKTWRSVSAYQKAQRERLRLEKQLGRLKERLEPDYYLHHQGVRVAVHTIRNRGGQFAYRFEFQTKHGTHPNAFGPDFGHGDLVALSEILGSIDDRDVFEEVLEEHRARKEIVH
jgi:hypothetical protein